MGENSKSLFEKIRESKSFNVFLRGLIAFLFLVLAVAFFVSITYSICNDENFDKNINSNESSKEYQKYILVVMYHTSDDFLNKFKEGIYRKAEQNQFLVDFSNVETINQAVDKINTAVAAGVDGIIAQGIYESDYIDAIKKAIEKGIDVGFVYTDARGTDRAYFVGYNAYDFGKAAARCAIVEMSEINGEIALMVQSISEDEKDVTGSLIIEGFKSITDMYPGVSLKSIARTSTDLFSSEDVAYDIIRENPDIDVIVCTSEKDAFGAAQVIIDLNRVGDIKIIGVGVSEEIMKYIDLEVISATFDMNPVTMSQKCIETLSGSNMSSDYVEIPFKLIRKDTKEIKK
jgi:ribose transport system substrate-binding protein